MLFRRAYCGIKNYIRNLGFAYKLFLALMVTALLTILPLGFFSYNQARKSLWDQGKRNMQEQVWQTGLLLSNRLTQCFSVVSSLLYNSQLQQCINTEDISYFQQYLMFKDVMEPTIENIIGSHSSIIRLKIYTDNATLKGHSRYLYDLEDFAGYKEIRNKRLISYQMTDEVLTVVVPFPNYGKKITNILYMDIRISDIFGLMEMENREVIILDELGETVYQSRESLDKAVLEQEGEEEISLGGKDYLLYHKAMTETGWQIICMIPGDTLFYNDSSILKMTGLVFLVAVGICMIMSFVLCRALLNPIKKLHENIQEIKRGRFDIVLHSDSGDEIGQLTNAFGDMTEQLDVLINEVYRNQIIQKETQLKMLQAQLNPHFLYNTLSYINWSALRIGAKDIAQISRDISGFYRTTLNNGNLMITIKEEMLNVKSYVNIQLALHHDSFDVIYEIEEGCGEIVIICNILQPLIENALEHGIDKKRDGRGRLKIAVSTTGKEVRFIVADNGPGFERKVDQAKRHSKSGGYGLENVNDRIRLFYGEGYGIEIFSEKGAETRIEIRLPIRKGEKENEAEMDRRRDLEMV